MGLLSMLGKIAGIGAAPFTGGASLALTGAGLLGDVLGSSAKGAAGGRQTEALLNNQRDALRNQQYGTQQGAEFNAANLDLNRKHFTEDARGSRAKQAMIGNLLANMQDLSLPGASNMGGLRVSALGEGGRASAAEMAKQAMLAQLAPDEFRGGNVLTPPQLSEIPKASGWEKAAGIGGILGSLGGALGSLFPHQGQPQLAANPNVPIVAGIDKLKLPGQIDPTQLHPLLRG